jgi:hypothetical protein
VTPDLHVVQHRHPFEEGDVLEGACDPQHRAPMGPQRRDVLPVEEDASAVGPIDAADAVEDAGLARAVGADDGEEVPGVDLQAHARQGGHAAEAQVQILQREQRHPRRASLPHGS